MTLNDDAVKIVLNTKGTIDDVSPEMKRILDYIEGKGASDTFTRELENAVQSVRQNEDWRRDYMTLQQEYQERFQEGKIEGKIELLAHDFHLTVPEIAEKLLLSKSNGTIDDIRNKMWRILVSIESNQRKNRGNSLYSPNFIDRQF